MSQTGSMLATRLTSSLCATPGDVRAAGGRLSALIFDVDGTLYEQGPLRRAIFYRLMRAHVWKPGQGLRTLQALYAFRKAQEYLRKTPPLAGDIARAQLLLAGVRLHLAPELVAACVARWMEQEPLPLLASSLRNGIVDLLQQARSCGLRLAVFSDYPAEQKLAAMGLAEFFDVVVTAQDPEVQRFKPDPAGLEVTVRRLGLPKEEAVYIGDRADIDAVAASRAGMRYFLLRNGHGCGQLSAFLRTVTGVNTGQGL